MKPYEEWCAKNTNITDIAGNMYPKSSTPEQYLGFYLSKMFDVIEYQIDLSELSKKKISSKKTFDIYIRSLNLVIEYDGAAFHSSERNNDKLKTKFCVENEINIVRIRENGCTPIRKPKGQEAIKYKIIEYIVKDNYVNIVEPIQELIRWINEEFNLSLSCVDVNIEKDADEILRYVQDKFHKQTIAYV